MQQKVLARSRQHFQTASVELTSFHLNCFGISGTCVLESAGPDSTFVFSVLFDIPSPEGLLLEGEFRSNFQDHLQIRHCDSGAIMATLIVKAIWDLTPDHVAVFYPSVLPSAVASSCHTPPVVSAALQQRITAGPSTQHSATARHVGTSDHVDGLRRPKYDAAEDSFYRSLLVGKETEARSDISSLSTSISAPKDPRIKLSADDTAFYSCVMAGVKAAPGLGEVKKPKPTKSVVNFEGEDIIIIDGMKYDTWGNVISDMTDSKPQIVQDAIEVLPACDELDAKKKLPKLGPTVIRGSNVLAMTATQASSGGNGGEHDGNRYLEILNGNLVPETQDTGKARDGASKGPGKRFGGTGPKGSSVPGHGVAVGTKSAVSTSLSSHYQKLQVFTVSHVSKSEVKKGAVKSSTISPLKTEDEFNDAWDAL